jgi:hypothetical protein
VLRLAPLSIICSAIGGLYYGEREASFEAKASEDIFTGIGGRRGVFIDGERRISNCTDRKCTIARYRTSSRGHAH